MSSRTIENKPKMTFWNFALMCYNDIDHLVIYHLKVVSEMYRKILNPFSWINDVSRGVVVDVNINFDTCTAWQGQMFGWLFFWQDVRVVNLSITHDYLFLFYSSTESRFYGNSTLNFAYVTSNFCLGLRQLKCTAAQSFEISSKHDISSIFWRLISTLLL